MQLSTSSALLNCPTHRRTWEKRAKRRFGMKEWGNSKLVPFNHKIRVDNETGEYYELGRLAPRRYREVMGETRVIQLGMMKGFGKDPKDKEVEVLYQGEEVEDGERLLVERDRPRPSWFSRSLLEKSHGDREASETVRPTGLV